MPTVTLLPGEVVDAGSWLFSGGTGTTPPTIVGDPPQWADGSDSTYATVAPADPLQEAAGAYLTPLTVDPSKVTAVGFTLRYVGGGGGTAAGVFYADPAFSDIAAVVPSAGSVTDWAYTFTDSDYASFGISLETLASYLTTSGARCIVSGTGISPSLTVYEMAVVVTYGGRPPSCRLYPRDDRYGPSPRIYPPPRSQQTAGRITGYQ